jgi:single-strand DNA-binding protein
MNIQNEVRLIGNLGKNPEIYTTDTGNKVLKVSLATSDNYRDKENRKVEQTDWHNLVAFGKTAELLNDYTKKGSKIAINGKLKTRVYQDKQGKDRYLTEIIVQNIMFLDKK